MTLCPTKVALALQAASIDTGLLGWAAEVKAWRKAIPNRSLKNAALALAEEAGEVCRAALKADEGIRPASRGNLADEIVDVLITAIGVADEANISLGMAIEARWSVIQKKKFAVSLAPLPEGHAEDHCIHCKRFITTSNGGDWTDDKDDSRRCFHPDGRETLHHPGGTL
jgi:NTP pyrophosphatase (non-canonical NTP hydrolase)